MRILEKVGRTVEEALEAGLAELGVSREQVRVEVLEEPAKGLFGLLGGKPARVRLTLPDSPREVARAFLEELLAAMGVGVEMQAREEDDYLYLSLTGKDLGILIGRRGETLDALQYILNLVVNRRVQRRVRVILDVENYRQRREQTLTRLAHRLSQKVKRTGNRVVLEPMTPHERRVIHTALQNVSGITTFSEGEEPFRKVVIMPKK